MAKNNNTERDRDATEQRMLKAVGEMIRRDGFEKLGVNAVAAHCGVSKILIYRYFGSLDGLLAAYIRQHDFWINFPLDIPGRAHLPEFLKKDVPHDDGRLHGRPYAEAPVPLGVVLEERTRGGAPQAARAGRAGVDRPGVAGKPGCPNRRWPCWLLS